MDKRKKRMTARKLRSRTGYYSKIIEILVPTRFYWDEDGEFDGIEFGPYHQTVSRYQLGLVDEALLVIGELMGIETERPRIIKSRRKLPIPNAFMKAFKDNKDDKEVDES